MNLYEVTLHGTDSIYLLASTKYRALELAGAAYGLTSGDQAARRWYAHAVSGFRSR